MPAIATDLANSLTLSMKSSVWNWRDGTRDIVDSGDLMNSQSVSWNGSSFDISYGTPYAGLVHDGGYIYPYGNMSANKVYLPGRPWISATLEGTGPVPKFDFGESVSKYINW